MEIIDLSKTPSLVTQYMGELRDKETQKDPMRFRGNIHRLGQIMAFEISKRLPYQTIDVTTPLGSAPTQMLAERVVLAGILRAGLALHEGMLSFFDNAENGFVSAYRRYRHGSDAFDVNIEYLAAPSIEGKTLILCDPMLATGKSMELAYRALLTHGTPASIHVASVIATEQAINYVAERLPENTTIWACAIDNILNKHSYIVPGLGDAGDLLYGDKL